MSTKKLTGKALFGIVKSIISEQQFPSPGDASKFDSPDRLLLDAYIKLRVAAREFTSTLLDHHSEPMSTEKVGMLLIMNRELEKLLIALMDKLEAEENRTKADVEIGQGPNGKLAILRGDDTGWG